MNLQDTNYNFFGSHKYMKLLNNLSWTSKSDRKNENIALLHMDADLYSSTFYVLPTLKKKKKILKGTLILFDNYFGYPGWKFHEHKAIQELFKGRYEYVAYGGGD